MIGDPKMLHLLWGVPVLTALYIYAARRRRRALLKFATTDAVALLTNVAMKKRRLLVNVLYCLAFGLIAIALARPAWNPVPRTIGREGRDIVFLLDVSKSMLAQDVDPSRLGRAKAAIADCVRSLQGDRVGLVAFAGSASIQCPLTLDYAFFLMRLDELTPDVIDQGGTRIGDAIATTVEDLLSDGKSDYQDIVLISDGEDHDSSPGEAAAQLARKGVRVIAIGIGDPARGGRIPTEDAPTGLRSFVMHENQEVWTRMEARTLQSIVAKVPNSIYLDVGTSTMNLPDVYREFIFHAESREFEDEELFDFEEKFQLFLGIALVLLLIGGSLPELKRLVASKRTLPLFVVFAALLLAGPSEAESFKELISQGSAAYSNEDYGTAYAKFVEASALEPESALAQYNIGNTFYREADYESALESFEYAEYLSDNAGFQAKCRHNSGNCMFMMARMQRDFNREAAAQLFQMSVRYYQAALRADSSRKDSAENVEVARIILKVILDEIQADKDAQKEIQKALGEIISTLEELIERQKAAANDCSLLIAGEEANAAAKDELGVDQYNIRQDTADVAGKMRALDELLPKMPSFDMNAPGKNASMLEEPIRHVDNAISAQDQALARLATEALELAHAAQDVAVAELVLALESMPKGEQNDSSEGDEGDQEYDEEYDEGEEQEEDGDRPAMPSELSDEETDADEFTAPKETPEDILQEEQANKLAREKKRPEHYVKVEKDW